MTFLEAKRQLDSAIRADDGSVKSARQIKFASRDLTAAAEQQVINRLDDAPFNLILFPTHFPTGRVR